VGDDEEFADEDEDVDGEALGVRTLEAGELEDVPEAAIGLLFEHAAPMNTRITITRRA
jgi:hypothetical protein